MADATERWLSEAQCDERYLGKDELPEFDTEGLLTEEDAAERYLSKADAETLYLTIEEAVRRQSKIIIDGVEWDREGSFDIPAVVQTKSGSLYYGEHPVTMPYSPPEGYRFVFDGYGTTGGIFLSCVTGSETDSPSLQFQSHIARNGANVQVNWRLGEI